MCLIRELVKKVSAITLIISINLFTSSWAEQPQVFTGRVNANNINLRSDSTVNSQIICNFNQGDYVEVVLELYDWYKIRLPKTAPSFIKKNLVKAIDNKQICVLKDNVNIRLDSNESSVILGKVSKDEIINILEDKGDWYKIEPVNNSFGWIHKKFVDKLPVINKTEDVKLLEKTEEDSEKNLSLEGIVKPYGKVIKRIATHKLITEDKSVFLLKGDKKNLDTLNYQKVKIIGKLITPGKQKYPIIEIVKIETLD